MRRIPISALRERIGDVLTHVSTRRERVVLTRHGREVGALVPMEDIEMLRALEDDQGTRTLRAYRASWGRITGPAKRLR
jgi:prevent-host-death family protein